MANSVLDMLIRGMPSGGPGLDPRFQTPGINPAAQDFRKNLPNQGIGVDRNPGIGSKINKGFGKLDSFLGSDGGSFLLNLLAQSGYSTVPGSPLGAIGRAGLATQQQRQAASETDLNRKFIESQIGLTDARTRALLSPQGENPKIGAVSPDKFTPESLSEFTRTGDYGALKPVGAQGADLNKLVNELADDARTDSAEFVIQKNAYDRIQTAAETPSAFGDLALIFSFMKIQDPRSSVREGEFANAENAGSVPNRVRSLYNKVLSGERLSEPQRKDLLRTSQKLYNASAKNQRQINERLTQRGRNSGLPDAFISPLLIEALETDVIEEDRHTPGVQPRPPAAPGESEGTF